MKFRMRQESIIRKIHFMSLASPGFLIRIIIQRRCFGWYTRSSVALYHQVQELEEDNLPLEWYRVAYARMIKLAYELKDVEQIDGRMTNFIDNSVIVDDRIVSHMKAFKSLAKTFIRTTSLQDDENKDNPLASELISSCFSKSSERSSLKINSLTKVCDFLNVSAQQRKNVRLIVCPQVTQHHIWRGSLEEILKDLEYELNSFVLSSQTLTMGKQILTSCLQFLQDSTDLLTTCPSWMRLAPVKKIVKPLPSRKWEEVLDMFSDLSNCLEQEKKLAYHVSKLDAMKEGLYQIKDILIDRGINYKEMQRQDCLVQKKLTKSLGHSSKCLFTLLLYYLHGSVRDIEVSVCGELYRSGNISYLCFGNIVTSCHEEMIWNAVKQLNRALGIFEFIWKTASMDGILKLQGHIWCLGARERTLTYRGNVYYVHGLRL